MGGVQCAKTCQVATGAHVRPDSQAIRRSNASVSARALTFNDIHNHTLAASNRLAAFDFNSLFVGCRPTAVQAGSPVQSAHGAESFSAKLFVRLG